MLNTEVVVCSMEKHKFRDCFTSLGLDGVLVYLGSPRRSERTECETKD